jgi:lipoprotein-anchoring transpeptidase ErfK/SrfK
MGAATLGAPGASAQDCFLFFCQGVGRAPPYPGSPPPPPLVGPRERTAPPLGVGPDRQYSAMYAPVGGEPFPIPAVKLSDIDPAFLRQAVIYPSNEAPGTIVIDPQRHFLYLVQGGGRAIRYGVGVGREGFGWSGVAIIHDKQAWPDWYPPKK